MNKIQFTCSLIILSFNAVFFSNSALLKEIIRSKDAHLNIGVNFVSPAHPEFNYAKHANRLFTPASNTKLFTAAAAFYFLGTEYTFKTSLMSDTPLDDQEDSVVHGNVYVTFCGDPSLTSQDLIQLFSELQSHSIIRIEGDIYIIPEVEESPEAHFGPGYCIDDIGADWNAPVSAYIIDRNSFLNADNIKTVVENPRENTQNVILGIFKQLNIDLTGSVYQCIKTSKVLYEVASHQSKPITELIAHMLKTSDNLYANALFKVIGKEVDGSIGSWQTGQKALKLFASECIGIEPNTWVISDGSGLSRYNLISPEQIVKLLTWVYYQKELFPLFADCLAIAGIDGTLKNRMQQLKGIVKAKTGTMGGISALSGYLCIPESEPYIFSIMLNGFIQPDTANDNTALNYKLDIEDALCETFIADITRY